MAASRELELPPLPSTFRFDERRRLVISGFGRPIALPVIQLLEAGLPSIRRLIRSRKRQVILARYLSPTAKQEVERAGWGWIETSGNAHIASDRVFVHIERPIDRESARRSGVRPIPPQGERIVRFLLDSYPRSLRVSEIARVTQLDKGYTSRILTTLRQTGLVAYGRTTPVEVPSPAELFEFWQRTPPRVGESSWYVSRNGPLDRLAKRAQSAAGVNRACFTGTFAAGLLVRYLEAERIDCYVSDVHLATRIGEALGGEPVSKGANLLFLVHRDPGILTIGTSTRAGLSVASVSQVYRDAFERGRGREREAANELRKQVLKW